MKSVLGSRVMHFIIANQIADQLRITDKDKVSFLVGGIAPDAVSPKDLSHFYSGDVLDYSRCIQYDEFLHKYESDKASNYILGYYSHLIADDLWLKGFYLPWLKNRMESDQTIFTQYHQDFRLLNGKLLDYYDLNGKVLLDWDKSGVIIEIEEVSTKNVHEFIPYLLADMNYSKEDLEQPLTVFTFNQIIGYIETSIDKGIQHINLLLEGEKQIIKALR